jgi:hypothetical protein
MIAIGSTGMFRRLNKPIAIGATMSNVATLSMKAEMSPEIKASSMIASFKFGVLRIIQSPSAAGALDSMNKDTTPIIPAIISITFQSTIEMTSPTRTIPKTTNSNAEESATQCLYFGSAKSKIYVNANSIDATVMTFPMTG